jgi:excisionase family DNA binding protein
MKLIPYSDLKYSIRILNSGDGTYSVEVPKLPGCYSSGRSKNECIAHILEAIELHLEGLKKAPPEDPMPAIDVVSSEPTPDDHLISLPEACKLLDISDATIRRYIKDGKIPAYNFGKEYKFKIPELMEFVDSTRVVVKPPTRAARTRRVG